MTKLIILLTIFLPAILLSQNIAINNDASEPHQSALLDISSTTKGILIPRMTTQERISISPIVLGLTVFDIDTYTYWVYRGDINGGWREMLMDFDKRWQLNGTHIYNLNNGNVGIGTNTPASKLTINGSDPVIGMMNNGISTGIIKANGFDMKINTHLENVNGKIILGTKDNDHFFIDHLGRVSIGTPTSSSALTINGSIPRFQMQHQNVNKGYLQVGNEDMTLGTNAANLLGNLNFNTKDITRMVIEPNGDVGIGTTNPATKLEVSTTADGQVLKLNAADQTFMGIWENNAYRGYVGSFYGNIADVDIGSIAGAVHLVTGSTIDLTAKAGNVGIGTENPDRKLKVVSNNTPLQQGVIHGEFTGTSTNAIGVVGMNVANQGVGTGVSGRGGNTGVEGRADLAGIGGRQGVAAFGSNGAENYGVISFANGGLHTYGIYASANGGSNTNYAGYFSGNVYTTGTYLPSDRKLKTGIVPLSGALDLINLVNPSAYNYNTDAYKHMHLPEGLQYGLIADELKLVIPGAVTKAVQPAEYENHDRENGNKLSDEVEFNAINYTAMVPILIAGVKEQQQMIEDLKKEIIEMKKLMEQR
ncbi:MAG: tail fiber domain-containing protein [Saprospiraceae bacterium]|nr:tail fiber domain-containing protein [Saprospiraceae bacterium]